MASDLNEINLLGIDVGFSKSRATTGIAWSKGIQFDASRTHSDWERRSQQIPSSTTFSVISIDGPLVPEGFHENSDRLCERLFNRGAFQKRCKPGLSHIGYGKDLRRAASDTSQQVQHLSGPNSAVLKTIRPGTAIIEAFPNAFLGVLLSEDRYAMPAARKRKKFDWLYDHAIESGVLSGVFDALDWQNADLMCRVLTERDHEKRAAWICLLTAGFAARNQAEAIGDDESGWFWLPPEHLWAPWARKALKNNSSAIG